MRLISSVTALILGVVLLILGFNASRSVASNVSETFTGAPSDKSMLFIIIGVICLLYGGVATIFNRK